MEPVKQRILNLKKFLRRRGESREDAEDLIQEAFLRLHLYCQSSETHQQEAFLKRTLLNLVVDRHRKEHSERYIDEKPEELSGDLALIDCRPSPDEEFAVQQRLNGVEAILNSLAPRTREVFVMHRLEGYSCGQIAKQFEISVSAVEKHIARAVLALMDIASRQ
jgi:RNA polymerase sigma factor (sigma-70 family)